MLYRRLSVVMVTGETFTLVSVSVVNLMFRLRPMGIIRYVSINVLHKFSAKFSNIVKMKI